MTASGSGVPARWWVAVGAAAILGGLVGGLLTAAVDRRGGESVCPAATVAARGLPAVVTIQAQGPTGAGTGSGEVIRDDGHILTNDHVIFPAGTAGTAGRVGVVFDDGTSASARIVGRDPSTDLAVVKVDADHRLPTIVIGS
jgi:putative serine protease PepD